MALYDTHDGRMKNGKGEATPQPAHDGGVVLLLFTADEIRQALVEGGGFTVKTSGFGKHKGGENTVLNLTHMFPVLSLLGLFVATEGSLETHEAVAGCVWVEDPYVKKCILDSIPKASCLDVQASTIFCIGSVVIEDFS